MSETPSARIRKLRLLLIILTLLFLAAGFLPYAASRNLLDPLAADGSLEMLTPELHRILRLILIAAGLIAAAAAVFAFRSPGAAERMIRQQRLALTDYPANYRRDRRVFFNALRRSFHNPGWVTVSLAVILIGGLIARILLLNRPMGHDESYTVVTWASGSLRYAISDYHLPNNHVFHTLILNAIYHHLGKMPFLMRLPAFLCGWLTIPLTFLLGKRLYTAPVGLMAAGFTAFSPFLIDYATNARGYSLMVTAATALFLLGSYLIDHPNRFGWTMAVLIAAAGFFTLPVMLYPFGIFFVWMFLTFLAAKFRFRGKNPLPGSFLFRLIASGFFTVTLTFICYLPLILNSGISALTGNVFVQPLPQADFLQTFGSRLTDWLNAFREGLPAVVWGSLLLGNLAALAFHRCIAGHLVPIQLAAMLWLVPLWLIQRPNLWPRTQIYFWPLLMIWGAAGICRVLDWLRKRHLKGGKEVLWRALILLPLILAAAYQIPRTDKIRGLSSPHEQAVRIVRDAGEPENALLVVAPEDDAATWYYADLYGLPKQVFDRNRPFSAVFVYVNPNNAGFEEPRTLPDTVERYGPGMAFLYQESISLLFSKTNAVFYRFDANRRVIEKTFGVSLP